MARRCSSRGADRKGGWVLGGRGVVVLQRRNLIGNWMRIGEARAKRGK
jgi:hypothetical protein